MTPHRAEGVAHDLIAAINRGDLGPGDRLPAERQLARRLGVGRATLREGLAQLRDLGYLEVRRGAAGGAFVTGLDLPFEAWVARMRAEPETLHHVLDLRAALESGSARLAAERRRHGDLEAMEAAVSALDDAGERAVFRHADARFHDAVAVAARSPRLRAAVRQARGELFIPTDRLAFDEQLESTRRHHARVLAAIRDGDAGAAAAEMAAHIETTRRELFELVLGSGTALPSERRTA